MINSTLAKTKQQSKVSENENLDSVTKYSISIMGGISALVGIWAATCIISAMVGAGGPLKLAQSWFSSITGM